MATVTSGDWQRARATNNGTLRSAIFSSSEAICSFQSVDSYGEERARNSIEAICVYLLLRKKERKKKRQYWVHPILRDRLTHGQFQTLYPKLRSFEPKFFNYLRMSINSFLMNY
ncbi:hypothetical protein SFRURICE_005549 [Spodoptera frugiperda]|nr:hypothetical protein SFRURICE_005549 [Spodoptera frugiperda]